MTNVYKQLVELSRTCKDQFDTINSAILELDYYESQIRELSNTIKHAYRLPDGTWISLEELAQRYDTAIQAAHALGEVYARD